MSFKSDLAKNTERLLAATFEDRRGRIVPTTRAITFEAGSVRLQAVFLYSDMARSTRLVREHGQVPAAKIVKSFLSSMNRLIRSTGGQVRSFDGDRVMGVFVGQNAATSAADCALKMHWTVDNIIRPMAEARFPSLKRKGFVISHCAGIAAGDTRVVRGGIRDSSDLVFVGAAPNIAAKLSEIRNRQWRSYMEASVWSDVASSGRYSAEQILLWERVKRSVDGATMSLYRSAATRSP